MHTISNQVKILLAVILKRTTVDYAASNKTLYCDINRNSTNQEPI